MVGKHVFYCLIKNSSKVVLLLVQNGRGVSSIGQGFFNPRSQLRCTDVTAFCMQLKKHTRKVKQLGGERILGKGTRDS